jgi:predicted regulator of Ras-like GTPase activity (Roadblock/LC7/MglB family)
VSANPQVDEFNWLLNTFVRDAGVVSDALAVSSDGLLMAHSDNLDREGAHQAAAIVSGLVSLAHSTIRQLDFDDLEQIIVATDDGFIYLTAMGDAGCLAAVTDSAFDMDNVGYQMGNFVKRAARMLTPTLVRQLETAVDAQLVEQTYGRPVAH